MSATDVAHEIRTKLPGTEEIIVDYLSGYLVDDAGEDEDALEVTRNMLDSFADGRRDALEELIQDLTKILEARLRATQSIRVPKLTKLDKVMDMSKSGAMSNTIAFTEGVDLESINKSKYVRSSSSVSYTHSTSYRASKVDIKKLEKQEAKLRVSD